MNKVHSQVAYAYGHGRKGIHETHQMRGAIDLESGCKYGKQCIRETLWFSVYSVCSVVESSLL